MNTFARIIFVFAVCVVLVGCGQSLQKQAIGKWQSADGTVLHIQQNGEASYMPPREYIVLGTYQWDDSNHIRFTGFGDPPNSSQTMEVKFSDDTLTTTNNGTVVTWQRID